MLDRLFAYVADAGELVLRLGLGIVFIGHGWSKLQKPAAFAALLRQLRVPAPLFFAWVVALLETVGAALIIVGVATRVMALGLAINMLVALVTVRIGKTPFLSGPEGEGWDFELLLLVSSLALVFTGAGRFALDPSLGL
jgi:putative oxidoreductase